MAVDSRYIYWTNAGTRPIGRADLDGQNVIQNFINTASGAFGVAVDSSHIYWANVRPESIGRADLDGQNVNQRFITGPMGLYGLAVDSSHIYWADLANYTIGRAELDGQNVNLSFINLPQGVFPAGWRWTVAISIGPPMVAQLVGPTWTVKTSTRASSLVAPAHMA